MDAQRGANSLKADLLGLEELPAISSTGSGEFSAKVSEDGSSFEYVLSFENLEGAVTQAHIHLGQLSVNGGISVWLCGTATNPGPPGTPGCGGPNSGGATDVVTAADVIGPTGQGIAPAEFEELLTASDGVQPMRTCIAPNTPGEKFAAKSSDSDQRLEGARSVAKRRTLGDTVAGTRAGPATAIAIAKRGG